MRKFLIILLAALFVFSGTALAQNVIKVNRQFDESSFVGYVENEFIAVLTDDAAESVVKKGGSNKANVLAGIAGFEAIAKRADRIIRQFPGAEKSSNRKSGNLIKFLR